MIDESHKSLSSMCCISPACTIMSRKSSNKVGVQYIPCSDELNGSRQMELKAQGKKFKTNEN